MSAEALSRPKEGQGPVGTTSVVPHVVLHQFPMSHFNEKVRFTLAWRGIEHERKNYLPGPHERQIRRLSGQSSVPVLELDGEVISGSATIIDRLESAFPDRRSLYPRDPALREEALAAQSAFDEGAGPAARCVLFAVMLEEPGYVARMFGSPQPLPMRIVYRLVLPLAKSKVVRAYRTDDAEFVARCRKTVEEALDDVARRTQDTGFVVGDSFSVADVTCASLLAPLANTSHPEMSRPRPIPERVQSLLSEFADHPAIAWVNRCYDEHR